MKKLFVIVVCLILSCGLMVGCETSGDTTNADSAVPLNEFNEVGTLQGTIMDATTGARIGGTDLTVKLIQGTNHRSPSRLITNTSDSLVGEYAFTNLPIALYNNNIKYKMVVTKTGYQRFESEFTFTANSGAGNIDSNYYFIGNIYLFPVGATAGGIEIFVERDSERVPGATVMLEQEIGSNSVSNNTTNTLAPTTGLMPVLTATTCTAADIADTTNTNCTGTEDLGKAVFAGTSLVLGGNYDPKVLPLVYEGTRLALTPGTAITVGTSTTPLSQLINMLDEEPGTQDDGLFVVYASNTDQDDVLASGILTIVFNRPVALVDETAFTATLACSGGCTASLTDSGGPGSVTAAVSTDGYTLTLTPVFTTAPVAGTDISAALTYAGGQITIASDETDQAISVWAVNYIDGAATVSTNVNVTGPQQ